MTYFFPEVDGTELEDAKKFKSAVKIPILVSSVHDPVMADKAIADGMCDMILQGRPLVADPEWANKVARILYAANNELQAIGTA